MTATVKYISEECSAAAGVLNQKLLNYTEKRDILKLSLVEGAPVSQMLARTAPWYVSLVPVHVLLHLK